jgi:hypothetical protein
MAYSIDAFSNLRSGSQITLCATGSMCSTARGLIIRSSDEHRDYFDGADTDRRYFFDDDCYEFFALRVRRIIEWSAGL